MKNRKVDMIYIKWLLLYPLNLIVELIAYLCAPIVALFITKRERLDRVKRLGNQQISMKREYLVDWLYWFQTHDNAVDEYWWGCFSDDSIFSYLKNGTQEQYDTSKVFRYLCRVMWLWRNCAYGFSYNIFGVPLDKTEFVKEYGTKHQGFWYLFTKRESSFQLEMQIPTPWSWHISTNIGWKEHDGFPRVMYASRIVTGKQI